MILTVWRVLAIYRLPFTAYCLTCCIGHRELFDFGFRIADFGIRIFVEGVKVVETRETVESAEIVEAVKWLTVNSGR